MLKKSLSSNLNKIMEKEGFIPIRIATQLTKWPKYKIMKEVDSGFISYRRTETKIFVNKEELLTCRYNKAEATKITNEVFENMKQRIHRLERKVEIMERMLDLYYEPLDLSEKELHAIYLEAEKLNVKSYSTVKKWAEVLLRLDESHFKSLAKYINNKECWKPFIELAYFCHFCAKKKHLDLRKITAKAYRNIKNSIVIYTKDGQPDSFFRLYSYKTVIRKARKNGSYEMLYNITIRKKAEIDLTDEEVWK